MRAALLLAILVLPLSGCTDRAPDGAAEEDAPDGGGRRTSFTHDFASGTNRTYPFDIAADEVGSVKIAIRIDKTTDAGDVRALARDPSGKVVLDVHVPQGTTPPLGTQSRGEDGEWDVVPGTWTIELTGQGVATASVDVRIGNA